MASIKDGRGRFRSRPLYATVFLMTLLATYALFLRGSQSHSTGQDDLLGATGSDEVCSDVHNAEDQCAFVRAHCAEDEPGLLSYLGFYYCALGEAKPVAFILLALWLGLLFSTIGIAASDFFSVNLSTIASVLGLPESLAGVTFLAFGNGSPDVFSTFAAMNSNSGSMAIGELIGAAGFITAVVAGSMALVREFKVSRKTFVRDIVFFILAVSFTMIFLTDGQMHLWECGFMIAFYVFYVCFVVGWHWFSSSRRRRRNKEAASRSHFSVASSHTDDEIAPYHDDVDDDEDDGGTIGQRRGSGNPPDISILESGPRVDADGSSQDEDEVKRRQIASEMTSSMRVNRPRGRRAHSTITPIRPSLVGALEFRSVLHSLQRSRNMRMAPLSRGYSYHGFAGNLARSTTDLENIEHYRDDPSTTPQSFSRDRALSSGDVPRNLHNESIRQPSPLGRAGDSRDESRQRSGTVQEHQTRSPSTSIARARDGHLMSVAQRAIGDRERTPSPALSATKGGHLAPLNFLEGPSGLSPELVAEPTKTKGLTPALSLQIPSPKLQPSQTSSPSLSPFPALHESPTPGGQRTPGRSRSMLPPPLAETDGHIPGLDPPQSPRPVKWWPYSVLPPPHVLWRTILPTLQGWRQKSIWDKIFSVVSMPSVFLLVVTLPVVETESRDDDDASDGGAQCAYTPDGLGIAPPAITVQDDTFLESETEWQEYRRWARSIRSRSSSASRHRMSVGNTPEAQNHERFPFPDPLMAGPSPHVGQPLSDTGGGSEPTSDDDEPHGWNRWLLVLQIFMGPLFTVLITWAKYMDRPVKSLINMVLYSLLISLVLLAVLLLSTSPDKKPKYHFLFCFLGFIIGIAWISAIAEEVVGILKAVGVILGMSEAILGLTIFAVGNSVGDLVADITVARLGYPVMALSACFGGPMLNILLGIGLGGTYMTIKSAKHHHMKHPEDPIHYKPYHIDVTGTLFISAMTVMVTLLVLLILVPANKWVMSKKIGLTLIMLWTASTIINVIVEVTGAWEVVA